MSEPARLATERYISLTTFKRDGTAVSTPAPAPAEYIEILLAA